MINILKDFGLDGVAYASDEFDDRRIYIGAYSYEKGNYVPIDSPEGKRLLKPSLTSSEFYEIISESADKLV